MVRSMNRVLEQKDRLRRIVTLIKLKDSSLNSQDDAFDDVMNETFFSDEERDLILFNLDNLCSICSKLIRWTKENSTFYTEKIES